jgi:glycosyltransferase involved in cell wall biosynthesis
VVKKICIISPSAYPLLVGDKNIVSAGGAEAQLSVIGKSLAHSGYDVHYLVDDFGQAQCERLDGVWVHKSPLRYMGGSNLYLFYDWLRFFKHLWNINADFHIIKLPRNLLVPLGVYTWLRRRKLVFIGQIDNDVDLEFIKHNEGRATYWFYRIGITFVDYIVAQNKTQRDGFKRLFNKKTEIIKSIITLPDVMGTEKDNYVLWVGSSLEKKQPEKYLELARLLPDVQFKMIVAPANKQLNTLLKSQAEEINNLEYLGFVPLSEIGEYFSKALLFVSTSLREGFPNTFLQSWQYGTPVISLLVDPDNVINNFNLGRLSGTIEKLGEDVDELVKDKSAREVCATNAKSYVNEYHSKDKVIQQYLAVLENL